MDPEKAQKVSSFVELAGCTPEQATFWLESSNWNLETATSSFFNSTDDMEEVSQSAPQTSSQQQPQVSSPSVPSPAGKPAARTAPPKQKSRIQTFSDLAAGGGSDDDDEDDGPETENYFAGGEKSGVMLEGGPRDKGPPKGAQDLIKNILTKAQQAGPAPEVVKPPTFAGSGYRLGSEDDPPAAGPSVPQVSAPAPLQPVERFLTFWQNGFSLDDGELRDYNAPENQEFLRQINSGHAPTSLLNVAFGQPVEVKVAHRMQEDYKPPPKQPMKAFQGSGNRLGSVTPGESYGSSEAIPGAFPGAQSGSSGTAPTGAATVEVDQSLPVTSIQIRLGDGTRLVVKLNHTNTVGDIRRFINLSRPGESARRYALQTTIPVKELADDSVTVKDAGLLNAVVVQRYT